MEPFFGYILGAVESPFRMLLMLAILAVAGYFGYKWVLGYKWVNKPDSSAVDPQIQPNSSAVDPQTPRL